MTPSPSVLRALTSLLQFFLARRRPVRFSRLQWTLLRDQMLAILTGLGLTRIAVPDRHLLTLLASPASRLDAILSRMQREATSSRQIYELTRVRHVVHQLTLVAQAYLLTGPVRKAAGVSLGPTRRRLLASALQELGLSPLLRLTPYRPVLLTKLIPCPTPSTYQLIRITPVATYTITFTRTHAVTRQFVLLQHWVTAGAFVGTGPTLAAAERMFAAELIEAATQIRTQMALSAAGVQAITRYDPLTQQTCTLFDRTARPLAQASGL